MDIHPVVFANVFSLTLVQAVCQPMDIHPVVVANVFSLTLVQTVCQPMDISSRLR